VLAVLSFTAASHAQPKAICVLWEPGNAAAPHFTYSGATITLKGIARGGATHYYWDYGDGSPAMPWTPISNPYNLGVNHAYNGAVGQLFLATLHVRDAAMNEDQDTYPIEIHQSADMGDKAQLQVRINMAIDRGLWHLHTNMIRANYGAGAPGYGQPYGYWSDSYPRAATGTSVDAFQLHGSMVHGDYDGDPYVETVQRALNYLLVHTYTFNIGMQQAGDPDTNGNGIGLVCCNSGSAGNTRQTYIGGICMVAIASSGAPNRVAAVGNANVYGRTFKDIVQDMVDFFAYGQVDAIRGVYRGGWRYYANYGNSDMSTTQWPPLAMLAAEQIMGCTVPGFVRTELPYFLNHTYRPQLDNNNGGYGYHYNIQYPNITKAAAGMICEEFLQLTPSTSQSQADAKQAALLADPKVQSTIGFIYRHWNDTGTSWNYTKLHGNSYGMYGTMKALRIPEPDILRVTEYAYWASPPAQTSNSFDWYFTPTGQTAQQGLATYCVNTQQSDGSWDDVVGSNRVYNAFCTGWRLLVLDKGVIIPKPVARICECGLNEYDLNEDIPLDGTCSYHPDPKRNIVLYEWDLDNDGVYDVTGPTTTITGGFPSQANWPVTLRVTDDNPVLLGGPQTHTHTCQILVHPPCHDPRADVNGPYLGFINVPVNLDASASADPDSPVLTYEWDLDNDGLFGAADDNCFGQSDDAVGVQPSWTWSAPYAGVIALKVSDNGCFADPTYYTGGVDVAYTTVDIGNHAPVSDPDGPYKAPPNGTITLDGSGSYDIDPGDSIVSYAWDLDNDGFYDDSTAQKPSFTAGPTPGTLHVVCLKVTDSFGKTDIACTTVDVISTIAVSIDIYPNRVPNRVILSRNYTLYVAVQGSASFDVTNLNSSTVKFGKTGTEAGPIRAPLIRDLNGDGFADAMYGFMTNDCGFALGDTKGILKAKLNDGTNAEGNDSVLVMP
jgi:hypothetical protein